jgi:hypothetical protein
MFLASFRKNQDRKSWVVVISLLRLMRLKFGKKKSKCGHHIERVWVFGLVERTQLNKIRFFEVKKRDEKH